MLSDAGQSVFSHPSDLILMHQNSLLDILSLLRYICVRTARSSKIIDHLGHAYVLFYRS